MLGCRDRIAERRVHHDDTAAGRSGNIDIVDADTSAANDLEVLGGSNQFFGDFGCRADGKTIVLADHFEQFFFVLAKVRQVVDLDTVILEYLHGGRRKFIGYEYARCHHGLHR